MNATYTYGGFIIGLLVVFNFAFPVYDVYLINGQEVRTLRDRYTYGVPTPESPPLLRTEIDTVHLVKITLNDSLIVNSEFTTAQLSQAVQYYNVNMKQNLDNAQGATAAEKITNILQGNVTR